MEGLRDSGIEDRGIRVRVSIEDGGKELDWDPDLFLRGIPKGLRGETPYTNLVESQN
ncbi:hypothetical protein MJ1HA_2465 [Metallosphaera sedula]|nr:hypothetical protein MJ1HA_2465 [Metallosphaera sedula]